MRKKAGLIVAMGVLAALGACLVSGCEDDRSVWWYQQHLDTVQQQLAALKSQLLKYKMDYGRYPTNDEGLTTLDYQSRFEIVLRDVRYSRETLFYGHGIWPPETLKERLRCWRREHSRPPANAEELIVATGLLLELSENKERQGRRLTVGIDANDNLYLLDPAGVLTFWMTPYVYENRQGLPAAKFDDLPANADPKRRYSIQVDDGVFVYSLGAREYAQKRDSAWWAYNWPRFVGGGLLVAALILLVWLIRRSWATGTVGIVALIIGGGAGWFVSYASTATCYAPYDIFSRRTPEMVSQQRELLDKYHTRGILGDQAYQKAVAALEEKPTSQPR